MRKFVAGLFIAVFCLLGSQAFALDFKFAETYFTKFMPGVQIMDQAEGGSLNAIVGPVGVARQGDYKLVDIGVIDVGFGTRFGEDNASEGKKITTHLGPGLCLFDTYICTSYIYDWQDEDWRINATFDAGRALKGVFTTITSGHFAFAVPLEKVH